MAKQKSTSSVAASLEQAQIVAAGGVVVLEHLLQNGKRVYIAETSRGLCELLSNFNGEIRYDGKLLQKIKFGAVAPTFVGYVTPPAPEAIVEEVPVVTNVTVVPESNQSSEPEVSVVTTPEHPVEAVIVVDEQQNDVALGAPVVTEAQEHQVVATVSTVGTTAIVASVNHEEDYLSLIGETSSVFVPTVVNEAPSFIDFYSDSMLDSPVATQEEQQEVVTEAVVVDHNVVTDVVVKSETIVVPQESPVVSVAVEEPTVKTEAEIMAELEAREFSSLSVEEKKLMIHWKMGRPMEKFLADLSAKHPPYKAPAKSETTKPAKKGWFW